MIEGLPRALTSIAMLGAALMAGVFFVFSTFVMRALERLPAQQVIASMQSINVAVINPVFMLGFLGTTAVCISVAIFSLLQWSTPGASFLLAGSLLYVLGTFAVTMIFNVPRNNALAAVDPASAEGARVWAGYLGSWTAWNHVRTATAFAAAVSFMMALRQG